MNYGAIKLCDIANGEGVRVSLFVSGCRRHCKGCFNEDTWDFNYGKEFTITEHMKIFEQLQKPYISGLSILGGEPFEPENAPAVVALVEHMKRALPNKSIWVYTGFSYELISNAMFSSVLQYIDVLVDGPYIESLRDPSLAFRGSSNQRIIDVKASRETGQIILYEPKGMDNL